MADIGSTAPKLKLTANSISQAAVLQAGGSKLSAAPAKAPAPKPMRRWLLSYPAAPAIVVEAELLRVHFHGGISFLSGGIVTRVLAPEGFRECVLLSHDIEPPAP